MVAESVRQWISAVAPVGRPCGGKPRLRPCRSRRPRAGARARRGRDCPPAQAGPPARPCRPPEEVAHPRVLSLLDALAEATPAIVLGRRGDVLACTRTGHALFADHLCFEAPRHPDTRPSIPPMYFTRDLPRNWPNSPVSTSPTCGSPPGATPPTPSWPISSNSPCAATISRPCGPPVNSPTAPPATCTCATPPWACCTSLPGLAPAGQPRSPARDVRPGDSASADALQLLTQRATRDILRESGIRRNGRLRRTPRRPCRFPLNTLGRNSVRTRQPRMAASVTVIVIAHVVALVVAYPW